MPNGPLATAFNALKQYIQPSPTDQWGQDALSLAKAHMSVEMPSESQGAHIGPMTSLERFVLGPRQAVTLPGGIVRVNTTQLPSSQDQVDDALAHELTHVQQNRQRPLSQTFSSGGAYSGLPYEQQPDEAAAFKVEQDRMNKRRDINLPKGR